MDVTSVVRRERLRSLVSFDAWDWAGALLPGPEDIALIAEDDGRPIGAAWWHMHEPPMLRAANGDPLPEMAMAVAEVHARRASAPPS